MTKRMAIANLRLLSQSPWTTEKLIPPLIVLALRDNFTERSCRAAHEIPQI